MYLAINHKADIAMCRSPCKVNSNPGPSHWQAAKACFAAIWRAQWLQDYLPAIRFTWALHHLLWCGPWRAILTMQVYWRICGQDWVWSVSWSSSFRVWLLCLPLKRSTLQRRGRQGDPLDASVYGGVGLWDLWAITAQNGQSVCDFSEQEPRAPWQDEAVIAASRRALKSQRTKGTAEEEIRLINETYNVLLTARGGK